MAEGARLESVYTFTGIGGSNPSLSASILNTFHQDATLRPIYTPAMRSRASVKLNDSSVKTAAGTGRDVSGSGQQIPRRDSGGRVA